MPSAWVFFNTNMKNSLKIWSVIFILIQLLGWFSVFQFKEQELKILIGFVGALILVINLIITKQQYKVDGSQAIMAAPIVWVFISSALFSNYQNYDAYHNLSIQTLAFVLVSLFLIIDQSWNEKIRTIALTMIVISTLVIITGAIELVILEKQPGRLLTGQQNISALIALISMPSVDYLLREKKAYLKIAYNIIVIAGIFLLFRSRFALIMSMMYFLASVLLIYKVDKILKFSMVMCLITLSVFFIINDSRFISLLFGNDIYVRFFGYKRFIIAILDNPFIGYGLGSVHKVDSLYQYLYPQIQILTGTLSFFSSHNDLIDKIIMGGIFSGFIYLFVNFYILIAGLMRLVKGLADKNFIYIYLVYIILLLQSLIDIHASNFNSLLIIYLFQILLLNSLVKFKITEGKIVSIIFYVIFLVPGLLFLFFNNNNYVNKYNNLIQNIQLKRDISTEIDLLNKNLPHFSRLDTINLYHYLFNTPRKEFQDDKFFDLVKTAQKYNKYDRAQIHLSSQYFSATLNKSELLPLYSDIFYLLTIENKYQNISNFSNVRVTISRDKFITFVNSDNKIFITLPEDIYDVLIAVNSSMGSLQVTKDYMDGSIELAKNTSGLPLSDLEKKIIVEFFLEINKFAKPVVFNR